MNNSQKSHAKLKKGPNQPNQQPSSLLGPVPTMPYPMHHNFNAFPPALGNQQFLHMFLNRANNPAQFPVIANQQNLNDKSDGSSRNNSKKIIPIIDPRTGERVVIEKRVTIDKKADGWSSKKKNKKESENTESNICVQPSTQVDNSNDSCQGIASKQHKLSKTGTACSPKNEEVGMEEMLTGKKKKMRKRNKDKQSEKPATAYLVLPLPSTTEGPTVAPTPDTQRNLSSELVTDSEVLNAVPMFQETLTTTSQNDAPTNQWNPLNPEGKKQYDREFLLQLASDPLSSCKLNDIPNVLRYEEYKVYLQNPPTNRKKKLKKSPPVMTKSGQFSHELFVPKHWPTSLFSGERQHLWKPLRMIVEPLNEKDKLKRNVLCVLNKLTPVKFETLLSQLKGLNINTEEKLALVCNLIFEAAINERKFSAVYAKLCKHLALIKVPAEKSGAQVNFRKLLLTKCEEEFELDRSNELKNEEKTKNVEVSDPPKKLSKKQKKLLSKSIYTKQIEYEEKVRKIKSRRLGNIRFIGELFKLNMFIEPIMHGFIKKLLMQGGDLSLECLSELLKTIGKKLDDKGTAKKSCSNQMDIYLAQIQSIIDNHLTSLRIRFMLQDVIDLKKNNWIPRREESYPKTLDEIRKEVEQQQLYNNTTNCTQTIPEDRDRQKITELDDHNPENNKGELEKNNCFRDGIHNNNDFEETIRCVIEMASPNTVHMFINATINDFLERSSEARYSLGQLLTSLLKKKRITFDQYKKGFAGVLEKVDDYAQNIPLIWNYIGEILEPIIEDIETPFNLLKEVLQPCLPSEKAGMLISSILHCAANRKGQMKLGEAWRESGVQWADIIGTDRNVDEFIKKQQLEFTVDPKELSPQIQIPVEVMKKHLLSVLEKDYELEKVSSWIKAVISDTSDSNFVHCLVTAVCKSCLSGSGTTWELNINKLKSKIPLISYYVSTNKKLQLQALYAAQALVNQLGQPSGLLNEIVYVLSDNDFISDESLKEWEKSDDPYDAEGKTVVIHSSENFINLITRT